MNTSWVFFFVVLGIACIGIVIRFIFYENYLKHKRGFHKGDDFEIGGKDHDKRRYN